MELDEKNPASVGEGREREEKIELRGLVTASDILGDNATLTLLGSKDNKIQTGTLHISDDGSICAVQEYDSAH